MPETPDSTDATPDETRPADASQSAPEAGTPDRQDHAGGFTINLASGVTPGSRPRRNKKSAAPKAVVQKTINLSTPKPESEKKKADAQAQKSKHATGKGSPKGKGQPHGRGQGKPRRDPRPSSGTSLADMLDPEVLAKLRGS